MGDQRRKDVRDHHGQSDEEEDDGKEFLSPRPPSREKYQRPRQDQDGEAEEDGPAVEDKEGSSAAADKKLDEVLRELGRVREQNAMTHGLLWALVLVTAAWHASELSLLLSARNKLFHPLWAIRGVVSAGLSGLWRCIRRVERGLLAATVPSTDHAAVAPPQIEVSPLPPMVAVPEMAHPDLPTLSLNPPPED